MASVIKIPEALARELDRLAEGGHKARAAYIVEVLWRDVQRNKQHKALKHSTSSWKSTDHPELTGTRFLNVDLDVFSAQDLQPLTEAIGKRVDVLYLGRTRRTYEAHFELSVIRSSQHDRPTSPDAMIRGFCRLIQALKAPEKRIWNDAKIRDFSIGIQAGLKPSAMDFPLKPETLQAAHQVGARIVVTVYPAALTS